MSRACRTPTGKGGSQGCDQWNLKTMPHDGKNKGISKSHQQLQAQPPQWYYGKRKRRTLNRRRTLSSSPEQTHKIVYVILRKSDSLFMLYNIPAEEIRTS
jgi:hypothetical protein